MSSGAAGLALIVILAVGFAGVCVALWTDARERDEDERNRQIRREIRRHQHPKDWTDDESR